MEKQIDWKDLATWLIDDYCELNGSYEGAKALLYYGLTKAQLLEMYFDEQEIDDAIKEIAEEDN